MRKLGHLQKKLCENTAKIAEELSLILWGASVVGELSEQEEKRIYALNSKLDQNMGALNLDYKKPGEK